MKACRVKVRRWCVRPPRLGPAQSSNPKRCASSARKSERAEDRAERFIRGWGRWGGAEGTHFALDLQASRSQRLLSEPSDSANSAYTGSSSPYPLVRALSVTRAEAWVTGPGCFPGTTDQGPCGSGTRSLSMPGSRGISPGQRGCSAMRGSHRVTSSRPRISKQEGPARGVRSRAGFDPGGVWLGAPPCVVSPQTIFFQRDEKEQVRGPFRSSHPTPDTSSCKIMGIPQMPSTAEGK